LAAGARSVCDDVPVSVADHQTLRVLEGRYVLERAEPDVEGARDGEVLAVVRGPDGGACMAGRVPVWVAASFDGDIVLVPADQVDEASELLRRAGHQVTG
jgi:hypothetical protein